MLAARFVKQPEWVKGLTRRDEAKGIPAFTLLDFIPSRPIEGGKLSFFWLNDEAEATLFASAFWLTQKDSVKLLAVSRESFEALGLKIESTDGETYHAEVNPRHFDVYVDTTDDAQRLAELFFRSGDLLHVTDKQIRERIANDNSSGLVDFKRLALSKNQNGQAKICDLLSTETLQLCEKK